MSNARNIASGSKFVDTAGDTMTGALAVNAALPKIQSSYNSSKHLELGVGGSGGGFAITTGHFMTVNHQPYADRATDNNLTERFRIDASGRVTTPSQPSFSVRSNAGNSGNTWQQDNVIKFQTVQHNVGSHYSTSTGRFTAPINGFYVFHYVGFGYDGGLVPAANTTGVALRRNGSNHVVIVYNYTQSSSSYPSSTGSVGLYLTANDYVEIYTTSSAQYADASNLYTHWSGYLLH